MDNLQIILNWAGGTALTVLGWFARQLWDAVNKLKEDLADLKTEIAKDYVPKPDYNAFAAEIRTMFQRISDKLDDKADK